MADNVTIDIDVEGGDSLERTRNKIEQLKAQMIETSDTKTFNKLALEAGQLETEVQRVEQAVTSLSGQGDALAKMGTSMGRVGGSLASLDFETAAEEAGRLAEIGKTMTFAGAIKSLKNLGSTFATMGKALLTNPFFLIAGVITAIVAGIVALMDELGLLTAIFDAVGEAIDWVIQKIKDLLDWLGLTSFAEEDAAQKSADAAKKRADAQEKASNRIIQGLDNEIALIEAKGEVSDEDFERILAIEAKKRETLAKTARARMEEAEAALKAAKIKGDLDEEEMQDLRDKLDETKLAYKNAQKQIEIGDAQAATKRRKRREEETKAEQKELEERQDAWEKYQQNRLDAQRQIEDLTLKLMEEGTDQQLEQINTNYDRLIEDTKANEELLQSEKLEIVKKYEKLRQQEIQEVNDEIALKEKEENQKKIEREQQQLDLLTQLRNSEMENELLAIEQQYQKDLELAKGNAELEKELLNQIESDKQAIRDRYAAEEAARKKALEDKKREEAEADRQERLLKLENDLAFMDMEHNMKLQKEIELEMARRQTLLSNDELTEQERRKIVGESEAKIRQMKKESVEYEDEIKKRQVEGSISATQQILDAVIAGAEEGSQVAKAAAIAQATIDTYKAAQGAYASLAGIPVVGPGLGAAAAAAAVAMGVMNVKKILSTPTPGSGGSGGGGGGAGATSSIQTPSGSQTQQTPQFQMFGRGNEGSEGDSSMFDAQETNQPQQIQAVVQWSDIDNVQNQNNNIQNQMQL